MDKFPEEELLASLQGKATREDEERVRAWLAESEENRARHDRFCTAYYRLHQSAAWHAIDEQRARASLASRYSRRSSRLLYALSGVAAALLLVAGLWWFTRWTEEETTLVETIHGGAHKATLILHDGREMPLSGSSSVDMGYAQAEDDTLSGLTYRETGTAPAALEYNTLVVPRGGLYTMTFSDGTRARVNAGSSVRYPVLFGKGNREIFVNGEIFLDVQRDTARPFLVHAGRVTTRVTGTSFNVMAYEEETVTEITLESGAVTVIAGEGEVPLVPGEQARVENATGQVTRHEVHTAYYTSWKEGLFDFCGMTLEELCRRLGRWYDVEFRFVAPEARSRTFTGAVKRDNTLRFMLDFIEKSSGTRFRVRGTTIEVYE
ncbi:MAG: FecR domain-containing protein [Odoribacteraceae bacterium]|jgi:ferric-dicitrate binding protein FerR (iron transport regulator)|nr:FecR domain-containing protein [Odoribacteraceae bacterium]